MWNIGIVWASRMVINGSVIHTWDSFTAAPVDSCAAEPVIPTPAPVVPAVPTPTPVVSNVTCEDIMDKKQCKKAPTCQYNKKDGCSTAKACSDLYKYECKSRKNKKRCKVNKGKTDIMVNGKKKVKIEKTLENLSHNQ